MKKGNLRLILLLAATVVVAAAILMLPSGEAEAETPAAAAETATETEAETETNIMADLMAEADEEEMTLEAVLTTNIKRGMVAPDFTVEMLDGSKIKLSELRGNVVLVNFWATWCPPCREELSHVQAGIIDRFAGKPFKMIAISRGELRAKVAKFIADNGYTFPVGLDPDETIFSLFASNYIPRNFLIGADGKVVFAGVGYDEEEFKKLTDKIDETLKTL